jgi:S-adenosylmethionine/arginine decarboxylase-like enzyme
VRAEVERPLADVDYGRDYIQRLISLIGMKVMPNGGPHADYSFMEGNRGLTVAAIIETSHVVMHIWDEHSPALVQLDVYSCSEFEPATIFDHLQELEPTKVAYKFLDRETDLKFII